MLSLAGVALTTRLVQLDQYTGSYPEGVRAAQLYLMSLGFRPFRDIFSDQGPWLLDVLYPGYALLGPSLLGVRAVVVLSSLIVLGAAWWLARQIGGWLAGVSVLALLALSPTFLKFSRVSVAEPVALAPAVLALGAALRFMRGGSHGWGVAAGVLLAVSLLIKPITLAAGPAVLLAALLRADRWRALGTVVAAAVVVVILGILLVGPGDVLQEIVLFRWQSRSAEGWDLASNLARAREELADDGVAFYLLGAAGVVPALAVRRGWPLALWAGGSFATLAFHSPLHAKHFTIILVPTAVLGALALAWLGDLVQLGKRSGGVLGAALAIGAIAALYVLELPGVIGRDHWVLTADDLFQRDASRPWYDDAVETLQRVTPPGSFVVTDHAYLAFAARRPLPPFLSEMSATRIRAGTLSDEQAIEHTRRFDSQALLLWADKWVEMKRYRAWMRENYQLVKIWAAEEDTRPELWLPRGRDAAEIRAALRAGLQPGPSEPLDGRLRAVSWGLDRTVARPGEMVGVAIEWEAVAPVPADNRVSLLLRRSDGQLLDEERETLFGGRELLEPGWWMFWVGGVRVLENAAPGDYTMLVQLRDRVNRRLSAESPVGTVRVAR